MAVFAPAHAQELERTPLSFASTAPSRAFINNLSGDRFYTFNRVYKDGKITVSGGMYDDVIGVACEWTLEGAGNEDGSIFKDVRKIQHTCRQEVEPEAWKSVMPESLTNAFDRIDQSLLVEPKTRTLTEVLAGYAAGNGSLFRQYRQWDTMNQEVCLKITHGDLDNDGTYHQVFEVDNGCFKLEKKDFLIKALDRLMPSQPV